MSNNNPTVSILVPIYNVQSMIVKCARSLFQQNYAECEFIFVDDGSTDYSYYRLRDVIDLEFPELYDRVRIVRHSRNRGVAEARNTAMDYANGEFILFVDSDDWVAPSLVQSLVIRQRVDDADMVSSDFYRVRGEAVKHIHTHWIGNREGSLNIVLAQSFALPNRVWSLLVRSSMIHRNGIRFEGSINYGEDSLLLVKLLYFAREIAHVDTPLYYYRADSAGSYSNNQNRLSVNNYIRSQLMIWDFMAERDAIMRYGQALLLGRMNLRRWLTVRQGGGGIGGFFFRTWCFILNKAWSAKCWASGV
ncbi:MAG: glycosyltransferase family 2 protein [Rikenellaceae bacterium]